MGDVNERDPEFWTWHCWKNRFYGEPCAKPATHRGPRGSKAFQNAWRACDEHHLPTDVPMDRP